MAAHYKFHCVFIEFTTVNFYRIVVFAITYECAVFLIFDFSFIHYGIRHDFFEDAVFKLHFKSLLFVFLFKHDSVVAVERNIFLLK